MLEALLGTNKPCQIGVIVKNMDEAKARVAQFLGMPEPNAVDAGEYSITKTVYRGQPAPEAASKLAFFELGNIQLELIEPNEAPSTWREHLEKHGEGMHHLGYQVKDIFKSMEDMKNAGYELTQFGYYGDGNGAYAYYDCTKELKCYIELLCSF